MRKASSNQIKFLALIGIAFFTFNCTPVIDERFQSKASRLFFNVDLKKDLQGTIDYYHSLGVLQETDPEGWTRYPPLSALRDDQEKPYIISFKFRNNPALRSSFGEGSLLVHSTAGKTLSKALLSQSFRFKSIEDAEAAYNYLLDYLSEFLDPKSEVQQGRSSMNSFFDPNDFHNRIELSLSANDQRSNDPTVSIWLKIDE